MCKMLEGGAGRGCSGDARLGDALNGRTLRGAEFHLLMERGQLKTRGFCSGLACVTGRKAALRFPPETLGPVPVRCRQGNLLVRCSPAQHLGAPWASQLLAGGVGEPRGWHDPT